MSGKKEQAINEIMTSFSEMANLVLKQLTLLEKLMITSDDQDFKMLAGQMREAENLLDNYEVVMGEQFTNTIVLYQPVASDVRRNRGLLSNDGQPRTHRRPHKQPDQDN